MTAIAGCVIAEGSEPPDAVCAAMMGGLPRFEGVQYRSTGGATFARALGLRVPEDRFDKQPLRAADRFLFVADVRIDNRPELIDALYSDPAIARGLSDPDLLFAAWMKWDRQCLKRVIGDYAFAVFDLVNRSLTLARDPAGHKPLFYLAGRDAWLFSSLPSGLLASGLMTGRFNEDWLARKLLGFSDLGESTWLGDMRRVLPATVVRIDARGVESTVHWEPPADRLSLTDSEFVEAYHEVLGRAVRSRLRRASGRVASQLSSGFDSSAVTITAADLSPADPPIAFTGAPRAGFDGIVPEPRIADESDLAAQTAAMYGLKHHVVRTTGHPLRLLQRHSLIYQEPDRNVINMDWWEGITRSAAASGATVLLTGSMGNLTLNWGGLPTLGEWFRHHGVRAWLHEARLVRQTLGARWTGVLFQTFGHRLSPAALAALTRIFQKMPPPGEDTFVQRHWLNHADEWAKQERQWFGDRDLNAVRLRNMHVQDSAHINLGTLYATGIDERDPTADQRVLDFSFRLPPDQLLKDGISRPLMRRALAGKLPPAILSNSKRGLQGADWYEQLQPAAINDILDEVAVSPVVNNLLDLGSLRRAVASWPDAGWDRPATIAIYRRSLTLALSAAVLVRQFEKLINSRDYGQVFSS